MKLYYLGPAGSFSHIVANYILNELDDINYSLEGVKTISDLFKHNFNNSHDLALIPIENSLGGSVGESLDKLLISPAPIEVKLEWVCLIEHYLIGLGNLADVQKIRGHYQAFAQCEEFINNNFGNSELIKEEMSSNSAAVKSLLEDKSKNIAAIGAKEAAELYQIPIIQNKIHDSSANQTRFWLIGASENQIKTKLPNYNYLNSLIFRIPQDEPGSLIKILNCLAKRKINLCKIESRPTKGRLCEYNFLIDFVSPENWQNIQELILEEIKSHCSYIRFLGNYPVWPAADLRFSTNQKSS